MTENEKPSQTKLNREDAEQLIKTIAEVEKEEADELLGKPDESEEV